MEKMVQFLAVAYLCCHEIINLLVKCVIFMTSRPMSGSLFSLCRYLNLIDNINFQFQTDVLGTDDSIIDINTLFVTEVIQESLYRDAYSSAHVLQPGTDLFQEDEVRDFMNNILKYKSPAIFRMIRLVLGDATQDLIQQTGRTLLAGR